MLKKTVVLVLIVCLLGTLLCACSGTKITAEEAYQIVLKDLGDLASSVENPHIHESKDGYNIYLTANGLQLAYLVSYSGKIVSKGPGGHIH